MTPEEWVDEIEGQKQAVLSGPKTNYLHLIHGDKELERQIQIDVIRAALEEEREACAEICDPPDTLKDLLKNVLNDRAAAIRARSEDWHSGMVYYVNEKKWR